MAGVGLTLAVSGRWRRAIARKVRPLHLAGFYTVAAFIALAAALLASRWPSYKLSWLNSVYAFLPSIRSLPLWWTQQGLQPNQTGGMLAVCTAMVATIALSSRKKSEPTVGIGPSSRRIRAGRGESPLWHWTAGFLTVAGVLVVFMTGSRAALAGLVVSILFLLIVRTRRWLWAWGMGIGLALVGLSRSGRLTSIFHFFLRDESLDTKLVARLDIWSSALRGIQDHFFTGIGLGVFNDVMPVRYPYQTVGLSYPVSQAHNLFLDIALSIGVPGALGLALLLAGTILLAIQVMRQSESSGTVALAIIAATITFLVFGITDQISFTIPTSFIVWLWACSVLLLREHSVESEVQHGTGQRV
jgi:hypothetical protein